MGSVWRTYHWLIDCRTGCAGGAVPHVLSSSGVRTQIVPSWPSQGGGGGGTAREALHGRASRPGFPEATHDPSGLASAHRGNAENRPGTRWRATARKLARPLAVQHLHRAADGRMESSISWRPEMRAHTRSHEVSCAAQARRLGQTSLIRLPMARGEPRAAHRAVAARVTRGLCERLPRAWHGMSPTTLRTDGMGSRLGARVRR